jgi:hypothetical protein
VDADLDTLATALYVTIDDLLRMAPQRAPWRPATGFSPQISDAELVTLAVMQAPLGSPASRAGSGSPPLTRTICSRIFRSSPATTSGCALWPPRSAG